MYRDRKKYLIRTEMKKGNGIAVQRAVYKNTKMDNEGVVITEIFDS